MVFVRLALLLCLPLFAASPSWGGATVTGELRAWHKVTLSVNGPAASEGDTAPNPFTDFGFWVDFTHTESGETLRVPGYFAADGDAGESGADSGDVWRAHLAPPRAGEWTYTVHFTRGDGAALDPAAVGDPVAGVDGTQGRFAIEPTDKAGRDFRGHGRLCYVGERYLRFAGTGRRFLKAGTDAPETLLAYTGFDNTTTRKVPLKTWEKHVRDWREGDPTWRGGRGKGIVGVVNYLADQGLNAVSFIPYNAGGDGDNVWPFVDRDEPLHYDCSKLDQWGVLFDHAQHRGVYLHFKLQETENDDRLYGYKPKEESDVPTALDGGVLGTERKLYLKELIARFGHALALNWNLGEENTQPFEEQAAMARYVRSIDPYGHHVVLHTYPREQEQRYRPHVGQADTLTGLSLQNHWNHVHRLTLKWVRASQQSGHTWVVANDEQGPHDQGVPPNPELLDPEKHPTDYTLDDIRHETLWGNLMAGGAGVEYYFGYKLPENDLKCEDLRSRSDAWADCRRALEFFDKTPLPLEAMQPDDSLVKAEGAKRPPYCLAKPDEVYLVYTPKGGATELDLSDATGVFLTMWYDPRNGGSLQAGTVTQLKGGANRSLGVPPSATDKDWVVLVRRHANP